MSSGEARVVPCGSSKGPCAPGALAPVWTAAGLMLTRAFQLMFSLFLGINFLAADAAWVMFSKGGEAPSISSSWGLLIVWSWD